MKKTWSTDLDEISTEMNLLVMEKARLFCLRENGQTCTLHAVGKTVFKDANLLVVSHPGAKICPKNQCLFYYHLNGFPVRGFHCTPEKLINGLLGVHYPEEIFEVQRRKFPRVKAARESRVSFSLLHRQKFHIGKIVDVSLQGAKISGDFPVLIEKGSIITPITLTLTSPHRPHQHETSVHVPEATVMRSVTDKEGTRELAIHFILEEMKQHEALESYIDALIRQMEDKDNTD